MVPKQGYALLKRCFDIIVSILGIIFLSPAFFIISILILVSSGNPVLFVQKRIGRQGVQFSIFKFRTMVKETPPYMPKPEPTDLKITEIGRFLRNTGLDELPQLLNVLTGQMSLVGPRPEMPLNQEEYINMDQERLKVKPGLTGLWQLSNKTHLPIHKNLEYDLAYIKNRSLSLDFKILLETLKVSLLRTKFEISRIIKEAKARRPRC